MSPMLKTLSDGRTVMVFGTKPGDLLALDPAKQGETIWRVSAVNGTPVSRPGAPNRGPLWGGALDDQNAYFGLSSGGVIAVRLTDGQRTWYTPLNSTAQKRVGHSAAATVIPGVVFVGGSDGRLWALSSSDGRSLWSFETAHPFDTVNRVPAHGGSISAPGPTVAGGMLFVGSGYGIVQESPGNVLLAFAIEP
jgi:polyvinyl alcohol dehydrogenase (cytochrome)